MMEQERIKPPEWALRSRLHDEIEGGLMQQSGVT
jgi:hypothetical protein